MAFFTNSHSHGRIFGIHNERCRSCLANPESHCTISICAVWIFWSRSGLGWWCGSWKCPIIIHDHFPSSCFLKFQTPKPKTSWRLAEVIWFVCSSMFQHPYLKCCPIDCYIFGRLNHKPYPRNMHTWTSWYWWYMFVGTYPDIPCISQCLLILAESNSELTCMPENAEDLHPIYCYMFWGNC